MHKLDIANLNLKNAASNYALTSDVYKQLEMNKFETSKVVIISVGFDDIMTLDAYILATRLKRLIDWVTCYFFLRDQS